MCVSLFVSASVFLVPFLKKQGVSFFSLFCPILVFMGFFLVNFLFSNESEKERVDLGGGVWEGSGRSLGRGNYDQNIL